MDIINEQNGWVLCCSRDNSKLLFVLHGRKKGYYRVAGPTLSHFKKAPQVLLGEAPVGLFYLGEYKPVCADAAHFRKLPMMSIIVNPCTNIAYSIKSSMEENNETKKKKEEEDKEIVNLHSCKFAGPYHPHLNADSYMEGQTLLRAVNYNLGQAYAMTFIIPFLHTHTTNVKSLTRTIASIKANVSECAVVVVTDSKTLEMVADLCETTKSAVIYAVEYQGYVGHLGFENRLNVLMQNNSDRASFYNYLLRTYGSGTKRCAIWEYNWVITTTTTTNTTALFNYRGVFKVPLWWRQCETEEDKEEEMTGQAVLGAVLNASTDKYGTTSNGQNVTLPSFLPTLPVLMKAHYSEYDVSEWRHRCLYGHQVGVKLFFENLSNKKGGECKDEAAPGSVNEDSEGGPVFKEGIVGSFVGAVDDCAKEKGVPQGNGLGRVENEKVQGENENEVGGDGADQVQLEWFFLDTQHDPLKEWDGDNLKVGHVQENKDEG